MLFTLGRKSSHSSRKIKGAFLRQKLKTINDAKTTLTKQEARKTLPIHGFGL